MSEPGGQPMSFAGVWTFAAFASLALVSAWRDVPLAIPPKPAADQEALPSQPITRSLAAVLPFKDILVPSPYAVGIDAGKPTDTPAALRREQTDKGAQLVCQLGAQSNHLGQVDGKALAKALAAELAAANVFSGVRYVDDADELKDEAVVIRGKVVAAALRIRADGKRDYEAEVELSAAARYTVSGAEQPEFWQRTVKKAARGAGAPAAYEAGVLVRGLCAEAADALGEAVKRAPLLP
jgi:hypothetical protein